MDDVDRMLLTALQQDATQAYAALGKAVGLSAGAAHERVRKLREQGVIRRTTVDVDPAAVGRGVMAFVLVEAGSWMGDAPTKAALEVLPEVVEAHVIAGPASLLVKVRTPTTEELQASLRRLYAIEGVTGTQTIVVLESFFERSVDATGDGSPERPSPPAPSR
ncbi:Lrp/AsnC family transcriptional regulator [Amycolatopsis keratiniphila]|uniref:Lrp/AsnC family transcriptional regulator n=1 Tax=Amycolatopsis keratiniphila TaxID=129921 RepID=UPI00087BC7DF|nr:Lrp/AsnC family transcriptional regulator [Amycolatopsis keratiniphila]OLZ60983.1 AsnC family transcriptional regulator [Amycolatopsis keratiniphila subsp. nogabecina]SDT98398.1 DNA-binding transcriptional regulator, Lrp family [Amycolatopsis keratiniphila]